MYGNASRGLKESNEVSAMNRFEQVKKAVSEECFRLFGRDVNLTTKEAKEFFPEFAPATISCRVSDGTFPRAGNSGNKPRFTCEEFAKFGIKIGRYTAV